MALATTGEVARAQSAPHHNASVASATEERAVKAQFVLSWIVELGSAATARRNSVSQQMREKARSPTHVRRARCRYPSAWMPRPAVRPALFHCRCSTSPARGRRKSYKIIPQTRSTSRGTRNASATTLLGRRAPRNSGVASAATAVVIAHIAGIETSTIRVVGAGGSCCLTTHRSSSGTVRHVGGTFPVASISGARSRTGSTRSRRGRCAAIRRAEAFPQQTSPSDRAHGAERAGPGCARDSR